MFELSDDDSEDEEQVIMRPPSHAAVDLALIDLNCEVHLPTELFLYIFSHLSQSDLVHRISVLSTMFYSLIYDLRFSPMVWDCRWILFNTSKECYNACVKYRLLSPKRIRIRIYRNMNELFSILQAVQNTVVELKIKTSEARKKPVNYRTTYSKIEELKLTELKRIAIYSVHDDDLELMREIIMHAPNLLRVEYLPLMSLVYAHPNWNNFTDLTVENYDIQMGESLLQEAIAGFRQLRTFEIKQRIDHDIVQQILSVPTLERLAIYCGKTLRKSMNHFIDNNAVVAPHLKRVKFTKYKSCSSFLGKVGAELTHLQLYTCNPIHSSISFQHFSNLTYLASFKSLTLVQTQQLVSHCKHLKYFYFKPMYAEKVLSNTDWKTLVKSLSRTQLRHLGATSIHFEGGENDITWIGLLMKYLPKLTAVVFFDITSNESPKAINSTPYRAMKRLRRYDVVGESNSGINHQRLFRYTPRLHKVVFKQRSISLDELSALTKSCPRIREIVVEKGLEAGVVLRGSFSPFTTLSKVTIGFDGSTNTISRILLAVLCLYKAESFQFAISKVQSLWEKVDPASYTSSGGELTYIQNEVMLLIESYFLPQSHEGLKIALIDCVQRHGMNLKPKTILAKCIYTLLKHCR
jgi:hypothetical protein